MDKEKHRHADVSEKSHQGSTDDTTDHEAATPVSELRKNFESKSLGNAGTPGRIKRWVRGLMDHFIRDDDMNDKTGDDDIRDDDIRKYDTSVDNTSVDNSENTVRLLLLGKTGTGKSTTGNTIFGKERFNTSPSFGSVTVDCLRETGIRGDTRLEIMDTPGLYDTAKSQDEICAIVVQAVAGMHPGPDAVLFVLKAGARFTDEEFGAYNKLKAIFDDDITRYVILVFTHGDELERRQVTLKSLLYDEKNTPANLKTVVKECGDRYLAFNNVAKDPRSQVDTLLVMVQTLFSYNGGKPYSCPKYSVIGQDLEKEVTKRIAKYEKANLKTMKFVQDLKRKTEEAEKKLEETQKEFKRKQEEMEQMKEVERMKALKLQELNEKRELELEFQKMKDHFREERRQDIEKTEKMRKYVEQARERQLEEEKKEKEIRETQWKAEMEDFKDRVVKSEERGFIVKGIDLLKSPFNGLWGYVFGE